MVTSVSIQRRPPEAGGHSSDRPTSGGLWDRYGRRATDLRISLIDKCNLRCTYCMPENGLPWLSRQQLLSPEEIIRLVRIGVDQFGCRELRLTGGEPLVRKDLEDIIAGIRSVYPELPIAMTSNAIGLERRAAGLVAAGLDRINISLDSVHPETFHQLTRRDSLQKVLTGIHGAADAGLTPLKINAVLMRGINDHEAADLLQWALREDFELRFIEQMPLDADQQWDREATVSAEEIRQQLSADFALTAMEGRGSAPAERYEVRSLETDELLGHVGIIASVTEPFCSACTRTRITAEGRVMSCLFSNEETDLAGLLRDPHATDDDVATRWAEAMWAKPAAHGTDQPGFDRDSFTRPQRSMSAIGG